MYDGIRVEIRASDTEPSFTLADGTTVNFHSSVPDCEGLDGGVPP